MSDAARTRLLEDDCRRLVEANEFLEHLLAASPSIVFRFHPATHALTYVSPNIGWLLGYGSDEALGAGGFWDRILHPGDRDRLFARLAKATANLVTQIDQECRYRGKDGRERWFHTLLRIEYDAETRPVAVLGYALDIADSKAAEEQVREAHERVRLAKLEVERASRAKSDFLSRMSHDLRTPLNAILGFAQILQMDRLTLEQAEAVEQILRGGVHLLELINEVLDIARIETGQLSLSPEPVAVDEVISLVVDLVRPLGSMQRVSVKADVVGGAGLYARADRQRLKQVLVNLVSNAVKYNRDDGQVRVSCVLEGGMVRILVSDTGPGISPHNRARLFQPFERLGAEQSSVEGTGLGLAVAKGLTEAMGGRIGFESAIDVGTTFWIELPHSAEPAPRQTDVPAAADGRPEASLGTVLYVEDNRSNIRLLERLLARRPGVVLLTASTGEAALRMIRERRPDLILLDLHLPDMNGEEVLRRLWASPSSRAIPVAVLSADATARQQQRLLAAGAVAYLTKPLDVSSLLQIVDERLVPGRVHK